MKKNLLLAVVIWMSSFQLFARSGDEVNNGGGIGEKNIALAYINMKSYLEVCLNSPLCQLSDLEETTLTKIRNSIEEEYDSQKQLQFVSERKNPGFFIIDDEIKVAKTGNDVGGIIYINSDLLAIEGSRGEMIPIGLARAVSILVHEFGHHHNIHDHGTLDLMGIKVSLQLQNQMQTYQLFPHSRKVMLSVFNPATDSGFPQVLLYLNEEVQNISMKLRKAIRCRKRTIFSSKKKPLGAKVHNLYWERLKEERGKVSLKLTGRLGLRCSDKDKINLYKGHHRIVIKFKMKEVKTGDSKRWSYVIDSTKVEQSYDPLWSRIKIPFLGSILGLDYIF